LNTVKEKIVIQNYYITLLQPKYNLAKDALAPMYGRKHSTETKKKMSEVRLGVLHPLFGKTLSDETKRKLSKARKGRYIGEGNPLWCGAPQCEESKNKMKGKNPSEETIGKLSNALKGAKNPLWCGAPQCEETKIKMSAARSGSTIKVLNCKTGESTLYASERKAALALSCAPGTIKSYMDKGKLLKDIYKITKE
jgi:hypothetical protein